MTNPFPLDIAFGDAFIGRMQEKNRIKNNVISNTHTLITAPRRFGKTSLVMQVLSELPDIPNSQIDLMMANSIDITNTLILKGINSIKAKLDTNLNLMELFLFARAKCHCK